jgi:peptidoglycan-associated lipoprotein
MTTMLRKFRAAGVAAALIAGLALSACASKQATDSLASAGSAAPGSQQDFVVNVGDRVFFDTDQTELSAQARATLDKQAQWLSQYANYTFTIEGHADERGTREYNIALGARRAQNVRNYLASRGIQAGRMRTVSYARSRSVTIFRAGRRTAAL